MNDILTLLSQLPNDLKYKIFSYWPIIDFNRISINNYIRNIQHIYNKCSNIYSDNISFFYIIAKHNLCNRIKHKNHT